MLAEILTIGDELCRGEIVNTNASWLAARLWDMDVHVAWMTSCRDDRSDMRAALQAAAGRAQLVLVTGGLGPTEDDLTVDVVAELLGVEPEVHQPSLDKMAARFARAQFRLTPNNLRQVRAPAGARVLGNPAGLAPAFEVALGGATVVCAPGVPRELHAIWDDALVARVSELRGDAGERLAKRIFHVFGMGESHISTALAGAIDDVAGASIHYQVKYPETLVKIVVRDRDAAAAAARLEVIDGRVRERLGDKMYGVGAATLAGVLGDALGGAGATLATAESCTGGWVGKLITDVPGSSAYYVGGAVTYADAEKVRWLGVREATLAAHGAVSVECVREMAAGAQRAFGADYAVAVSGVAGPGGGTDAKPVGTVWLAAVGPDGAAIDRMLSWPGEREQIRELSAHAALALVLRLVKGMRA